MAHKKDKIKASSKVAREQEPKKGRKGLRKNEAEESAPQKEAAVTQQTKVAKRRQTYKLGQHGAKWREQKRLTEKYKTPISGKTHESEHTIGFAVLNDTDDKRGENKKLRKLENKAPAYQERRAMHRKHIGTGNRKKVDDSGFSARTYRDAQRRLLEDGDVSSATQLNQLGYAFLDGFQEKQDSAVRKAARDSYDVMVKNMKEVGHTKGGQEETALVDKRQQAEMYLARRAAETGKWPTAEEIAAAKKKFGIT